MRRIALALALLLAPCTAFAQEVVADLSQSRVAITATFHGSEILIFGAVKHLPGESDDPLDVIVTVSGPRVPVMVRKKERVAGIWVNTEALEVDLAPTFYSIATTAPLAGILSDTDDLRHKITIPRAIRSVDAPDEIEDAAAFSEAVIRIRTNDDLYRVREGAVSLAEQTLFRTTVDLPSNLVEGDYTVRIFLSRNKEIIADFEQVLDVRKVGLERWIYNLAHQRPLIYGLLSLAIAIAAGWGASAAFRYVRG